MLKKFWSYCKVRWAYLISIAFVWVVPIIMLNEYIALAETNIAFKLTFAGCLTILVIFLALRKKIYAYIHKKPHGVTRGVLLCIHKGVTYGLFLGVLWAINAFSNKLFDWWLLSGLSILIGVVFIIIDEIIISKQETGSGINETT